MPQNQYAFAGRGAVSCLRDIHSELIDNVDKSKHSVVATIDLKSAYGTVDVDMLCKMLVALGASLGIVEWFKSFPDVRIIETRIGGAKSDKVVRENEVTEGSPLSATLFIILIIDIHLFVKTAKLEVL